MPFAQFSRPFRMIRPCRPEKLLAPWGGGYPFLTKTLRGEYAFFMGIFLEKYHSPQQEILDSPLKKIE